MKDQVNQIFEHFDDQDPAARILKMAAERELQIRANIEAAAQAVAEALCLSCLFRPYQAESMTEMERDGA